jgi:hypothetical protein
VLCCTSSCRVVQRVVLCCNKLRLAAQFLLDHIHRKLQPEAATLADDRLFHVCPITRVCQGGAHNQHKGYG